MQESLENLLTEQANDGVAKLTGATTNLGNYWKAINWHKVGAEVKRLQMRIAKAVREGKKNKVKVFQWMLSHSFSAKLLAVKRVTSNKGAKTPGVDLIIWNTPARKMRGSIIAETERICCLSIKAYLNPQKERQEKTVGNTDYQRQGNAGIISANLRSDSRNNG